MHGNPNNPRTSELEWLMALAVDAAEIQMRQYGNVGAALVAITPSGLKLLECRKLLDDANKDAFASAVRLCCVATAATVGVSSRLRFGCSALSLESAWTLTFGRLCLPTVARAYFCRAKHEGGSAFSGGSRFLETQPARLPVSAP